MISISRELSSTSPLSLAIEARPPADLLGTRVLNADVFRVSGIRDNQVISVSPTLNFEETTKYDLNLPDNLAPGLYKLNSFRVQRDFPHGDEFVELLDRTAPFDGCPHFVISETGLTGADPDQLAEIAYTARFSLITEPHVTPRAILLQEPQIFSGIALCHGALIYEQQNLRGISIVPYGQGLDYSTLLKSASAFTQMAWEFEMAYEQQIAEDYAQQTSTCAVVFHQLKAVDANDAFTYVANEAEDVITIIGAERGFKPIPFMTLVFDGKHHYYKFYYSRYTGNLFPSLSSGKVGARIEEYLPKIRKSPRARLLLETFAQATSERDYAFRHFRYWALLEWIAKDAVRRDSDRIFYADGNIILDQKRQAITTKHAIAKVYKYLFDSRALSTAGSYEDGTGVSQNYFIETWHPVRANPSDEVFPMWSVIGALYEIRNQVAHTGTFKPNVNAPVGSRLAFASRFYNHPSELLFQFLRDEAWRVTRYELNKI